MKNNDFIGLFNSIVSSYFVVENKFYKADGKCQVVRQYAAGMDSKRAYTILTVDKNDNQYVAVDDEDYNTPFCYSWMYRNKQIIDNFDYMFFNIKNPKDMCSQILSFLNKNKDNIEFDKLFYLKHSTKIMLKQNNNCVPIAEVLMDRSTISPFEYIHFNYRNIDLNIIPISEKTFKTKTSTFDEWVDETIENNLQLK